MFSHLTDYGYTRTTVQAIGFYIAYFVLFLLIAALLGGVSSFFGGTNDDILARSTQYGIVTVTLATPLVTYLVVSQKKVTNNFLNIILIVGSGLLALFGGALFGLIPVAFLTTKPSKHGATSYTAPSTEGVES